MNDFISDMLPHTSPSDLNHKLLQNMVQKTELREKYKAGK